MKKCILARAARYCPPISYFKSLLLFISLFIWSSSFAQNYITVTGTVEDKTGPLEGVNVSVKGTSSCTLTDRNGKFSLAVPDIPYSKCIAMQRHMAVKL
jgi:hypothetical protein